MPTLLIDDDKRSDLKATHGAVWVVETDDGDEIAFRKPTPQEYRRFKATALDEAKRMHADENLARDVIVFPDPKSDEFKQLFERLPALPTALSKAILKAAGYVDGLEARKL
ncbi:MAG: hypothetical protein HYV09_24760 [Deltaproteobacteria bacterium]|nr:hypothetical protein [Deltaproteobacteria bacterium]